MSGNTVAGAADPPTLAAFRTAAMSFLREHAEPRPAAATEWGAGSDGVSIIPNSAESATAVEAAKIWRRKTFDAGFGWISGPARYGGRALGPEYERAYAACVAQFAVPDPVPFAVSLGMVAPTLLSCGSDLVKDAYLRRLYRGDVIGCQMFSEPGAGSDLASVSTRADRDGNGWVISGQKVWTSGAQFSDIGEVLCRTDVTVPKHRGMTMFVIDMHAPGVDVRPLRQMTGGASFNEVFLDGVRVPDDHRLGEVDGGWQVAMTTLMHERSSIGDPSRPMVDTQFARVVQLLKHYQLTEDPLFRQAVADLFIHEHVNRHLQEHLLAAVPAGAVPGPEMSLGKLALTNQLARVDRFVADALGPALGADTGEWGTYAWTEFVLGVPGMRLGGGTDEVLRNVIAERVLRLPKDSS